MEEWDDIGDSQNYVDNQKSIEHAGYHSPCANHALWQDREEAEAEYRMWVIMRNGNSGEHYDIYDDGELEDVE